MEPSGYADIFFFAAVAVLILLKLRSVLGRKNGGGEMLTRLDRMLAPRRPEQKAEPEEKKEARPAAALVKAARKATRPDSGPDSGPEPEIADPVLAGKISAIKGADKNFNAAEFLRGAKTAFEIALNAFSKNDRNTLKDLLAEDVYKAFADELDRQEKRGDREEVTLVSINKAEITDAALSGNIVSVTVAFESSQIRVRRDSKGMIAGGDPSLVDKISDIWTFERNTGSRDPNWMVVAT